jgi:hypothetical protein
MNVATGNIAADALDQVFASFDFKATGEPIKVTSIYVKAYLATDTGTDNVGLDNAKIFVDGSQIGSTADLTEVAGPLAHGVTFSIGNGFIIQPGVTKVVEIRADVKDSVAASFATNDTIQIMLSSTDANAATGNSTAYTKTISLGTANTGGVAGYTRTVKTGALTTAVNASVVNWSASNPVGVVGATNVLVGSFIATVGSGEAVYIDDVQVTDNSAAFTELQNVKVKVNGTEVGTTVATPVTTTTYTYSLSPRIEAVAASQVLINVYADIKSSGTLASPDAIILSQVSATGKNTSADAKDATDRTGQTLVSSTGGSLSVSLSGNTPSSAILVMGTTGATEIAKYVVEETTGAEDMIITKLIVTNTAASATNLINYSLWDGTTQAGSTQASSTSAGVVTFSGLTINVPKSTSKTLTIKAQANTYPNASAGTANVIEITAGTTDVTAEGASSGPQTVTVASNLDGNTFKVYRTNLTATKGTVTGDGLTGRSRAASQAIAQVKLVADAAYNAKIRAASTADAITDSLTPASPAGIWGEVVAGAESVTTSTPIIGTNAIRYTAPGAGMAAGDGIAYTYTVAADWSSYSKAGFWARSNQTADNMTFTATDSTAGAVASTTVTFAAANTWQYVEVTLPTIAASKDGIATFQLLAATALAAADTVDIDNFRLYNDSVVLDVTGDLLAGIPDGVAVTLKDASSTTKMTGYYTGTATAGTVTLLADSEISVGNSEQIFTVYTSTSGLMLADTTANETLNVSIDLGNASTAGDIRWYDGAVTATSPITWVSGSTPVSFSFGY